jgi:hypothetical protein
MRKQFYILILFAFFFFNKSSKGQNRVNHRSSDLFLSGGINTNFTSVFSAEFGRIDSAKLSGWRFGPMFTLDTSYNWLIGSQLIHQRKYKMLNTNLLFHQEIGLQLNRLVRSSNEEIQSLNLAVGYGPTFQGKGYDYSVIFNSIFVFPFNRPNYNNTNFYVGSIKILFTI